MYNESPVLKRIHDRYDAYNRYPHTDHSVISQIAIKSRPDGYRITTYPGGYGSAYDGFVIQVQSNGKMFDDVSPVRVETARDNGGLMELKTTTVTTDDSGNTARHGTISTPAAREGLVLPGDDGFEMFEEMHGEIRNIKEPLRRALGAAGMSMDPIAFNFHEWGKSRVSDNKIKKTTRRSMSTYEIGDGYNVLTVNLDGTVTTDFGEEPSKLAVYRRGTIEHNFDGRSELPFDGLIAFSGLHSSIRGLYIDPADLKN